MIDWLQIHRFLCIMGDAKPHQYNEIQFHAINLFNHININWEKVFRKCMENGLVSREGKSSDFKFDTFILSSKGDEALRDYSVRILRIKTGNNEEDIRYYKGFDRTSEGLKSYVNHTNEII